MAEHALALVLAGRRCLDRFARADRWTGRPAPTSSGARVTILGGGGITTSLLRMLGPFGCDVTVVRRRPEAMAGATRVVGDGALDEALTGADVVVLALALTPRPTGSSTPAASACWRRGPRW